MDTVVLHDLNASNIRALGQAEKGRVDLDTFQQASKAEPEAGLALTKGILKAAYQCDKLSTLREKWEPPNRSAAGHSQT